MTGERELVREVIYTHLQTVYVQRIKLGFISLLNDVALLNFCQMLLKIVLHIIKAKKGKRHKILSR